VNLAAPFGESQQPPTWQLAEFRLRPLRSGDEVAWAEYLANAAVIEHTSIPAVSLSYVANLVQRYVSEYASGLSCRWALAGPDDRLIGTCGFSNWSLLHSHAELVYDLAPSHWGRGHMTVAIRTVLGWAFEVIGFNRVHALVMVTNQRSIAVLERCGFSYEGTLRRYRIARGAARDFHMYSVLREDFRATLGDAPPGP